MPTTSEAWPQKSSCTPWTRASSTQQLEVFNAQATRAEEMRGDEHKLYEEDSANVESSVTATDEPLEVIKESDKDAGAFIQLSSRDHLWKGAARRGSLENVLKLDPGKRNPFKPKVKTFSIHGGGVIETFRHLEEGWTADRPSDGVQAGQAGPQ